jgi:hypothetical protein
METKEFNPWPGQTVIGVKEDEVMGEVNCQTGYINISFYIERKGCTHFYAAMAMVGNLLSIGWNKSPPAPRLKVNVEE